MEDFPLKPTHLIDFPCVRQSTNFSCGAACTQGVLYYYGTEIREDNLIKEMGVLPTEIEHSGINPHDLVGYLKKRGLQAELITEMSLETLGNFIQRDIPVIVAMQAWRMPEPDHDHYRRCYNDGHYIVAIGYNADVIFFEDPSVLSNRAYLPIKEFIDRWHDKSYSGTWYQRLGIPVYGLPPKYRSNVFLPIL